VKLQLRWVVTTGKQTNIFRKNIFSNNQKFFILVPTCTPVLNAENNKDHDTAAGGGSKETTLALGLQTGEDS